jgi:hypothetical protein
VASTRDYKAEYARRIAKAAQRGLSRSQARGHARVDEAAVRPSGYSRDRQRFEAALKLYRETGNQAVAAKAVKLAPERLRRFLRENVQIEGRGRSLKITDNRNRYMMVTSAGQARELRLRDFEQASLNGRHQAAIRNYLQSNDLDLLMPFEGRAVIDFKGKSHPLETNPNTLHRLAHAGDEVFHDIYRLVI